MSSERPSSSRRDFLTGRAVQAAVADSVRAGAEALVDSLRDGGPRAPSGGATLRLETRAMNCDFAVLLNPGPGTSSNEIESASEALDLVHALETQMTVYRAGGELAEINRRAAVGPLNVEPRLFALLLEARRISVATESVFDPTSGPLIALWRACRGEGRLPTADEVSSTLERTGLRHVVFDEAASTIRYDQPGVELNLGAIGKGHALDRMAESLTVAATLRVAKPGVPGTPGSSTILLQSDAGASGAPSLASRSDASTVAATRSVAATLVDSFLLHGGHSSLLARGDHNRTGGWPVGLRNPAFPTETMATLLLKDVAMSTSGAGEQFYRHDGKRYGHILDPRTGWPAEGMLSVTVLAPTGAEADALSTAFFVGGVEIARRYCDNHPEVAALFTPPLRSGRTVGLGTLNLPEGVLFPAEGCVTTRL